MLLERGNEEVGVFFCFSEGCNTDVAFLVFTCPSFVFTFIVWGQASVFLAGSFEYVTLSPATSMFVAAVPAGTILP